MPNTGPKQDSAATLLQSMMDSLKTDIFWKIDALSMSLRSEISSVRQEFKNAIEPLQRMVDGDGTGP